MPTQQLGRALWQLIWHDADSSTCEKRNFEDQV